MMNGAVKLLIGLLLMMVGVWIYLTWNRALIELKNLLWLFVGNLPALVIFIGLIVFLLGISDMKS
ncbi:MAG TPA: hypothetical protein VJJ23_00370 [Candidatus Nanoarchaeia archaeon]|nr:hypothetical protein [Candidatus Nanoarchaeia archaeon]